MKSAISFILSLCLSSYAAAQATAPASTPASGASTAAAEPEALKCLNDPDNKQGYTNMALINSLANAKDPLSIAFKATQISKIEEPSKKKSEFCLLCMFGRKPTGTNSGVKDLQQVASAITTTTPQIKKECVLASLQREVSNNGYLCDSKGDISQKFRNRDKNTPCMDNKVVDFVLYALNQAIDCMSPNSDPIDARFILKKINNETAFNFFMAYSGGVGIGQLTSPPVKDLAGWYSEGKKTGFNTGNAYHILEDLMASTKPSCAPFKKIVGVEMEFPPPAPGREENYCKWVSVGEGIGRNLVYGLGYYVYSRDSAIKPAVARTAPNLIRNKELINSLTLVAYGPGGPAQAKSIISGLRLNNKSDVNAALKKISQKSAYVNQTDEKMEELLDIKLGKDNYKASDIKGDLCITR